MLVGVGCGNGARETVRGATRKPPHFVVCFVWLETGLPTGNTYGGYLCSVFCVLCSAFCVLCSVVAGSRSCPPRRSSSNILSGGVPRTAWRNRTRRAYGNLSPRIDLTHFQTHHSVQPFCFRYEFVCQDRLRTGSGQAQDVPMAFAS